MSIKAAVIGHPISHSKSPLIHGHWIEKHGLTGSYEAIDVPCGNLENRVRDLVKGGYVGFNVTLPHKEDMLDLCNEVDEIARAVGAVNTVQIRDGRLFGTNTDVFGFVENVKIGAPDFDFAAGRAVVLGAGGAARAVVQGLLQEGAPEILLLNRTQEKAQHLVQSAGQPEKIKVGAWGERSALLADANIVVNSTSLGMQGQPALEIDLAALPKNALVSDIVYAPLMTDLLKAAQGRGNPVVTGIGMLLHQARPAFQMWFGVLPEVDEALERLAAL